MGIGTQSPQALLNLDFNGTANSDTFLVGNTTKGMQLRDTGGAVDLESLGAPLFINYATGASTYLFNLVGIGTSNPQVELNLDQGDTATNDALLIGNYNKGLQLRDTGAAVDLESWGVPLFVNNVTQQPEYLNPSGGLVTIGYFPGACYWELCVGQIPASQNPASAYFQGEVGVGGIFGRPARRTSALTIPSTPLTNTCYTRPSNPPRF